MRGQNVLEIVFSHIARCLDIKSERLRALGQNPDEYFSLLKGFFIFLLTEMSDGQNVQLPWASCILFRAIKQTCDLLCDHIYMAMKRQAISAISVYSVGVTSAEIIYELTMNGDWKNISLIFAFIIKDIEMGEWGQIEVGLSSDESRGWLSGCLLLLELNRIDLCKPLI